MRASHIHSHIQSDIIGLVVGWWVILTRDGGMKDQRWVFNCPRNLWVPVFLAWPFESVEPKKIMLWDISQLWLQTNPCTACHLWHNHICNHNKDKRREIKRVISEYLHLCSMKRVHSVNFLILIHKSARVTALDSTFQIFHCTGCKYNRTA